MSANQTPPVLAHVFPGDPADPHGLPRACLDFLEHLAVRQYAPRTIYGASRVLSAFTTWCYERGVTRTADVSRPVVERYQRHLHHARKPDGTPLAIGTQYGRLVHLRGFFRYLVRANRILANPAADLDLPRPSRRLPLDVLTATEAEAVLAQPDLSDPLGLRDRAILEVFYSTGIRRIELVRLSVFDVDMERGTLLVRLGKGRKDRVVPIGDRALAWVDKYLVDVRSRFALEPDDHVLFLTHAGESLGLNRASALVRGYVEAANVGKLGSCHLFRHTMATLMLEGGADIRYIQQMLGHAELTTTEIYTQVAIRQLKAVHTATHPGATNERHRSTELGEEPDDEAIDDDSAVVELHDALVAEEADEDD